MEKLKEFIGYVLTRLAFNRNKLNICTVCNNKTSSSMPVTVSSSFLSKKLYIVCKQCAVKMINIYEKEAL